MNPWFTVTLIFLKKTELNRYEKDPLMSIDLAEKAYHNRYILRSQGWGMGKSEVPRACLKNVWNVYIYGKKFDTPIQEDTPKARHHDSTSQYFQIS